MSANDGLAIRAMASMGSTSIDFEFIRHSLLLCAAGEEAILNVLGLGIDELSKPRRRRRNICRGSGLNMCIACMDVKIIPGQSRYVPMNARVTVRVADAAGILHD